MKWRFILFTWMLILPLNLVAVTVVLVMYTWQETGNFFLSGLMLDAGTILTIGFVSVVFSLPGLAGLAMLTIITKEFIYGPQARYTFICLGCLLLTLLCYVLFDFLLHLQWSISDYMPFFMASLTAVLLSLFINRKYFTSSLMNQYEKHLV